MATWTKIGICNMAIYRIGQSKGIVALTESSVEADACNFWYDKCLAIISTEHTWNFMIAYDDSLTAVGSQPANIDWEYAYRAPVDMDRPISLSNRQGVRQVREKDSIPFTVGSDGSGMLIYTDEPPGDCLMLKYTKAYTDPTYFPNHFAETLAWKLAVEIAMPLGRDVAAKVRAETQYALALSRAISIDATGEQRGEGPASEFEQAITGLTNQNPLDWSGWNG